MSRDSRKVGRNLLFPHDRGSRGAVITTTLLLFYPNEPFAFILRIRYLTGKKGLRLWTLDCLLINRGLRWESRLRLLDR